jgi:hypothetical protein
VSGVCFIIQHGGVSLLGVNAFGPTDLAARNSPTTGSNTFYAWNGRGMWRGEHHLCGDGELPGTPFRNIPLPQVNVHQWRHDVMPRNHHTITEGRDGYLTSVHLSDVRQADQTPPLAYRVIQGYHNA